MTRNVRPIERYAWLAAGIVAGIAASRTHGWRRAAFSTVAAAGMSAGLSGYSPINQAFGRRWNGSPLEEGLRDTELRRQMQMSSALGSSPSGAASQPRVTHESDMFSREPAE